MKRNYLSMFKNKVVNGKVSINSSVIMNVEIDTEIQFDLQHSQESNVVASTMVSVDQLITTNKATSYTMAMVYEDVEVGTLELSIVKQQVSEVKNLTQDVSNAQFSYDEPQKRFSKSRHNMSQNSWSMLADDSFGPSTYETSIRKGYNKSVRPSSASFTMGSKCWSNATRFETSQLNRSKFGQHSSDNFLYPKVDAVKSVHRGFSIGSGPKIDNRVLNPTQGRSPGPIYNTSQSFVDKLKHFKIGTAAKFQKVKDNEGGPGCTKYSPDWSKVLKSSYNVHFESKFYKTHDKPGEPAMFNLNRHPVKSIGGKSSRKSTVPRQSRGMNSKVIVITPASTDYETSQKKKNTISTFGSVTRNYDIRKYHDYKDFCLKV